MAWIALLRWLHVIGATVLLGTGAGIAFFMAMAVRTRRPDLIAHVAATVAVADLVFTATAVVVQPITGGLLAHALGWPLGHGWVAWALGLYVLTGACWLPVVWIQLRLRDLARAAADRGEPLPPRFDRLYRVWLALGVPAFAAVLAIVWLMTARPAIAWP
jgi:uncharacterized membrane protein